MKGLQIDVKNEWMEKETKEQFGGVEVKKS